MSYPSRDYDGLEVNNTDPFANFELDAKGGVRLEDDVDECEEDDNFNDVNEY